MEINKLVDLCSVMCYELVIRDDIWRFFSFKRKPSRGKFFDFFISNEKLATEKFIQEELIAINFSILFSAIYSNYYDSRKNLNFSDWQNRAVTNEGKIVTGILDRIWYHRIFENLNSFLKLIEDSVRMYRIRYFEENISFFIKKFSNINSNLSQEVIKLGAIFLFNGSDFSGLISNKVIDYKRFLTENPPEGKLYTHCSKEYGNKFIQSSIKLLEIEA